MPGLARSQGLEVVDFASSLLAMPMVRLNRGEHIEIRPPGDRLLGFYAVASKLAGSVQISLDDTHVIKILRHRAGVQKPFVNLRHLTVPLRVGPDSRLQVRARAATDTTRNCVVDPTMLQVVDGLAGGEVLLGDFLFLENEA